MSTRMIFFEMQPLTVLPELLVMRPRFVTS